MIELLPFARALAHHPAASVCLVLLGLSAPAAAQPCDPHWEALSSGVNGVVVALLVHDEDGAGPLPRSLFVGGSFTIAGGTSAPRLARWNGVAWSRVGATGFTGQVVTLMAFDEDGAGADPARLYAAGTVTSVDGIPTSRIARWVSS